MSLRNEQRVLVAIKFLLVTAPVGWMLAAIREPITGDHIFRRTHVAANIDKYLEHGLSMRPATYNLDAPYSLFDFPLFQMLAASASNSLRVDPLVMARLLNIGIFVACFIVLDRLLARIHVRRTHALFCLFFFSAAPVNLFYFRSTIVDGLAICLSLVSAYACVRWREGRTRASDGGFYVLMLVSGIFAALIKNPVYFMTFVGIVGFLLVGDGRRRTLSPALIVFVILVGLSVVLFRSYANHVNGVSSFLDEGTVADYFGPMHERLDADNWLLILGNVSWEVMNPLTLVLAVAGVGLFARHSRLRSKWLFLGAFAGVLISTAVFFGKHPWHNYYQWPFVIPLAFFAGYAFHRCLIATRTVFESARGRRLASGALVLGVVAVTMFASVKAVRSMSNRRPTETMVKNGKWIYENTGPSDFVVYVLDSRESDWNPAYLYFAKRDGVNLSRVALGRKGGADFLEVRERYSGLFSGLFVFCPAEIVVPCSTNVEKFGGEWRASGSAGRLYVVGNSR